MENTNARRYIVANLIQQKLDGKLSPSVFQAKTVSKKRSGIITKDMWYKIHPLPIALFVTSFISVRRQGPRFYSKRQLRRERRVNQKSSSCARIDNH